MGCIVRIDWKKLALCLLIPLAVGALSSLLTQDAMENFELLNQPPLSPPTWLFPIVWTILFIMMGVASYLVVQSDAPREEVHQALRLYGVQLFFNFCWTLVYFNLGWRLFAFVWLLIMWVLILLTLFRFRRISKAAGYWLLPYLLWTAFAGYLNLGVYLLN